MALRKADAQPDDARSPLRVEERARLLGPGNSLWNSLEETDLRYTKSFDRGSFKGTAVDAISNVKRISELLGPVGFAWGWEVKGERLDTFGIGEDQQMIHTLVLRAWFKQPDGSKEHVEHIGHTKAAYWARLRKPGDKARQVIDEEFGKKSLTDALSKIMVSLGASADIWLGRFDGNKYVAPKGDTAAAEDAIAGHEDDKVIAYGRQVRDEAEAADDRAKLEAVARKIKGAWQEQPFWPRLVSADRELAAEIQQLVRGKAQAHELDLSKV